MRSSKSRSRKNNRNRPQGGGNIPNRVFDSSGPEGKVRGTPQQIIDKYLQLARDAQLAGDRVATEAFYQHAEHYLRLLGEAQREIDARREQQERENRERQAERDRERAEREAQRAAEAEARAAKSSDNEDHQPDQDRSDNGFGEADGNREADSNLVETPESKPKKPRAPRKPRKKPAPKAEDGDQSADAPAAPRKKRAETPESDGSQQADAAE